MSTYSDRNHVWTRVAERLALIEEYELQGYRPLSAMLRRVNDDLVKVGYQPISITQLKLDLTRIRKKRNGALAPTIDNARKEHDAALKLVKQKLWRTHHDSDIRSQNKVKSLEALIKTEETLAKLDGSLVQKIEQTVEVNVEAQARHLVAVLVEVLGDEKVVEKILTEWQERLDQEASKELKLHEGK